MFKGELKYAIQECLAERHWEKTHLLYSRSIKFFVPFCPVQTAPDLPASCSI